MYSAIIFDLDGTLLDTEALAMQAAYWAHEQLNVPVDRAFLEGMIGKDEHTCRAILARTFPDLDTIALDSTFRQRMHQLEDDGIPIKPGVTELLDHIEAAGLPRAVATSSSRARAEHKLALTGLAGRFDTVVTLDCVKRAKPSPDPFLLAAERLDKRAPDCLAFEDSEAGAAAAMAAGMTVVQVPDVLATDGRFAHHVAPTLLDGARMAGLIG